MLWVGSYEIEVGMSDKQGMEQWYDKYGVCIINNSYTRYEHYGYEMERA